MKRSVKLKKNKINAITIKINTNYKRGSCSHGPGPHALGASPQVGTALPPALSQAGRVGPGSGGRAGVAGVSGVSRVGGSGLARALPALTIAPAPLRSGPPGTRPAPPPLRRLRRDSTAQNASGPHSRRVGFYTREMRIGRKTS